MSFQNDLLNLAENDVDRDILGHYSKAITALVLGELTELDEDLHAIMSDVQGYDGWSKEFVKGYVAAVRDNHLNVVELRSKLEDKQ